MKKIIIGIVVVVLIIIGVSSTRNKDSDESIKIGAIISETGVAAAFGEMSHRGIDLAVEEINSSGGIDEKKVTVIFENDQTDPKVSSGLFQKLTGINKVDAIMGSNFDFVTQPLFSLAKTSNVVVVSPSNPRIPGAFDTNAYSFVMMTEFSDIIRKFDVYLKNTQYNQLGILRFESSFGESIQNTLNDMQKEMGKNPIVAETYKQIGNNDFKTVILKLKQAKVDLLFLDMVGPDPITFLNQAKQLSYYPTITTHIGIQDAMLMKDVDPNMFNGVYVINWNASPESFVKKFEAKYGIKPDKSADKAYDAVYVLAQAISKSKNPAEIVKIMETSTFTTPSGLFKFNSNHAADSTEVLIQKIEGGKLVDVK